MRGDVVVLRSGDRPCPAPLAGLPVHDVHEPADLDAAPPARRVIVLGDRADLARVLTGLLRADRLGVEVALVTGGRGAANALSAPARPTPLIRDETGTVLSGAALWLPADPTRLLHGEAVVDDTVLFDGDVRGVRVEPTGTAPGLRAAVLTRRWGRRRWVTGRAAQLGTTGARVVRDGVQVPRPVRRSTFYRHVTDWLAVP